MDHKAALSFAQPNDTFCLASASFPRCAARSRPFNNASGACTLRPARGANSSSLTIAAQRGARCQLPYASLGLQVRPLAGHIRIRLRQPQRALRRALGVRRSWQYTERNY